MSDSASARGASKILRENFACKQHNDIIFKFQGVQMYPLHSVGPHAFSSAALR